MTHPITLGENKAIRDRMLNIIKNGLHRTSATNIIFVCGGDGEGHLRPKFVEYMSNNLPEYLSFRPESAQKDYFEQDHDEALNLSQFEELVSDLSLGIILFAESPGSYAETGLFSALDNARKKTLVILDAVHQGPGSFLALGPVATISGKSRLGAAIQLEFKNPNFDLIRDRIRDRIPVPNKRKAIAANSFSELTSMEIMAIIWFFVRMLRATSFDDLIFLFNSAYGARVSKNKIRQILSVLVGAGIFLRHGAIDLIKIAKPNIILAEVTVAYLARETELSLEIADLNEQIEDEHYVEAIAHVG